MQTLRKRLSALHLSSLDEWFKKNEHSRQFILMLSNNNAACFIKTKENLVKLEIAPAYLDSNGVPHRESHRDENGVLWESILVFYERETHRKYPLTGLAALPPKIMEEVFSQAEEAYQQLKSKTFRPSFLFDYIENWR